MKRLLALIAVLAMVLAACGDGDEGSDTTADGGTDTTADGGTDTTEGSTDTTEGGGEEPAGDPIVFATSLPLTGEFSGVGSKHQDGYQFCVDEINARGGLLGRPVELLVEDNRSDTEVVVTQTERFITVDGADVLFGTFSSLLGYPASTIAEQNGMVYPMPSSGALRIWERGYENIFYFQQLPAEATGSSMVDLVNYYTEQGIITEPMETMAVVSADDFFAGAIANGFLGGEVSFPDSDETVSLAPGYAAEMGMEVVFDQQWPVGFTDWLTLANSIAATQPDMIVMTTASVDESISLLRALETVGYNDAELVYSSQGAQSEFQEELGATSNGVVIHSVWAREANWEGTLAGETYSNEDFISGFEAAYGRLPDEDEALPFAVCQGMEQAIIGTGGTDNAAMSEWLHNLTPETAVRTIVGDFVWDERGLPDGRAFLVNQWQDDTLALVYPVGEFEGTADLVYPKPPFGG
ncbi:MAG TPA: amino acid ABC transporter substrate-binding protein [Acidimicrobiia bacterium]|nr:amino acid ABC transporter substrate-binding protein [Acidimicrobiia bacterium]